VESRVEYQTRKASPQAHIGTKGESATFRRKECRCDGKKAGDKIVDVEYEEQAAYSKTCGLSDTRTD
jgi:hypothetical protein